VTVGDDLLRHDDANALGNLREVQRAKSRQLYDTRVRGLA